MSGSLLRSAGSVVRRSIPQAQGSFHRSPVRLLSGGAGRFDPSKHSSSKPNNGYTKRLEDGHMDFCRGAEHQKEWNELAAQLRVVRDKLRVIEQTVLENEKLDVRREKVLMCASVLLVAGFGYLVHEKTIR